MLLLPVVDRAVAAVDVPTLGTDDVLDQVDQVLAVVGVGVLAGRSAPTPAPPPAGNPTSARVAPPG